MLGSSLGCQHVLFVTVMKAHLDGKRPLLVQYVPVATLWSSPTGFCWQVLLGWLRTLLPSPTLDTLHKEEPLPGARPEQSLLCNLWYQLELVLILQKNRKDYNLLTQFQSQTHYPSDICETRLAHLSPVPPGIPISTQRVHSPLTRVLRGFVLQSNHNVRLSCAQLHRTNFRKQLEDRNLRSTQCQGATCGRVVAVSFLQPSSKKEQAG